MTGITGIINSAASIDLGSESKEKVEITPIIIEAARPLNPSTYMVLVRFESEVTFTPGQYLKLHVLGRDYYLSVSDRPHPNVLRFIVGGSALSSYQSEFIDYCMVQSSIPPEHRDKITEYSLAGKALSRKVGSHPILMIASGTGMSYINSILLEYLYKSLELEKGNEKPIELVWGCSTPSLMYANEQIHQLATAEEVKPFFTYHPLSEFIHPYHKSKVDAYNIIHSNLVDYLKTKFDGVDLSGHLIYIGGSKKLYDLVSDLLINSMNANPLMIISDNK